MRGSIALRGAGQGVPAGDLVVTGSTAIGLLLSEAGESAASWVLDVLATSAAGSFRVATIVTRPPILGGSPGARLVGVLRLAGADRWQVSASGPVGAVGELAAISVAGEGPAVEALGGSHVAGSTWTAPALVLAQTGTISAVPCVLRAVYGQLDPAAPGPAWVGIYDSAGALVGGEIPRVTPVRLAAGASWALDFGDGLALQNGAQWGHSTVPGTYVVAAGLAGLVQGEIS